MRRPFGIIPPTITVFHEDESIDEEKTCEQVDWLIANGVDGIAACGSTGEAISMTPEERNRVVELIVKHVNKRVPVYAGTGHFSTKMTVEASEHAATIGADGLLVILPYYMLPPKKSVMDHYRIIRETTNLPLIVYNNPWFAGYELTGPELAQLVEEDVVHSVKSANGNPYKVTELKFLCGDKMSVLYGHDYAPLEAFFMGADGWLSGMPNVFPKEAKALFAAAYRNKDVDEAHRIQQKLQPWIHFGVHGAVNGSPHWLSVAKESLNILGRDIGKPRLPLQPLTPEERGRLEKIIALCVN